MNSWPQVAVEDLIAAGAAAVRTGPFGTQLHASDYVETGTPVINVRNIGFGTLKADKIEFVANGTRQRLAGHLLEAGDIVFGRKGAVERHLFVTADQAGWMQGSDCLRLRLDPNCFHPQFASYVLLTEHHKTWIKGQASHGATMATLNQGIIGRILLPQPSLPIQRRIASILGAYDDLIEVNRRRIAVLEEMARRLFDEWFVHFRFPGHEGHAMAEAEQGLIPLGWKWEGLERVCVPRDGIQTGPFGSQLHQSDYTEEGVPVAMPKNLIGFRIVTAGIARIPEAVADSLGRHRMRTGDVVYGRRGDIGRRAYVSAHEDGWFCGTGCLRLRPDQSRVAPRYFFDALGISQTLGSIKGRAQGATMPNLSAGAMVGVPVLVPPLALQQQYAALADTSASLTGNLAEANSRLASSRDLLLPRLISGDLAIDAAEAALEQAA